LKLGLADAFVVTFSGEQALERAGDSDLYGAATRIDQRNLALYYAMTAGVLAIYLPVSLTCPRIGK